MDRLNMPAAGDWSDWLVAYRLHIGIATLVLVALVVLQRSLQFLRRRRPAAPLNPRLQKYGERSAAELQADRQAAEKIIATSSTGRVAGYEVIRQIEAVFVEGYRTPDDAVTAIKVAAGKLGANAIINLSQQRSAAGRCACQGDAVLLRAKFQTTPEPPPQLGKDRQ
jgi:hypothetical protein